MAINATAQWRIRTGGSDDNGAGYDPDISGAGTNYTDQDAAQLVLTDLATSGAGSTTLTSAAGGFTSAMIGNAIQIRSGTNFDADYYFIVAHTDTNTVTLDRSPTSSGVGSGGSGKVGGAWSHPEDCANSVPTVASPLAGGHRVYVQGSGSDNPTSADYTFSNYRTWRSGGGNGYIRWIGYNGRPALSRTSGVLIFYSTDEHSFENLKFIATGTNTANFGFIDGRNIAKNCIFDAKGFNAKAVNDMHGVTNCLFENTGASITAASPYVAISGGTYNINVCGNVIDGWGRGIYANQMSSISDNIIINCSGVGIEINNAANYRNVIMSNTIVGNGSDGLYLGDINDMRSVSSNVRNNIFAYNQGYGINVGSGNASANEKYLLETPNFNAYFNNTSGAVNNANAGASDVTLTGDPFTDRASGDYSLNDTAGAGAACKAAGFPGAFLGGSTTSYVDLGAAQRQETGGGGGTDAVLVPQGLHSIDAGITA